MQIAADNPNTYIIDDEAKFSVELNDGSTLYGEIYPPADPHSDAAFTPAEDLFDVQEILKNYGNMFIIYDETEDKEILVNWQYVATLFVAQDMKCRLDKRHSA